MGLRGDATPQSLYSRETLYLLSETSCVQPLQLFSLCFAAVAVVPPNCSGTSWSRIQRDTDV
jgi:hypothetical protein